MRSFWAIVKLTFKNSIRSHIFQLLLIILALCIFLIPNTITGDGTPRGFIQISLKYSMAAVAFVLSLSSVWLGCYIMTRDVENYQLHMVISKPISRVTIWFAKWFGISLIHAILLVVAASVVYVTVMWQFYRQPFTKEEKTKIENEVLVGRRVFMPEFPDIEVESRKMLKGKIASLQAQGKDIDTSPAGQEKLLNEIRKEIMSRESEIGAGKSKLWKYTGLPKDLKKPLFLRYRIYVNKISTDYQRLTRGIWLIGVPIFQKSKTKNVFEAAKDKGWKLYYYPLTQMPQQLMCGVFHEFKLPPRIITPDGEAFVSFNNLDPQYASLYAQQADGPKLLLRVTGFTENYFRAVFVVLLQLLILAGLGCAAASVLSMPTAVFLVISYLMFGSFASYMVSSTYFGGTADYVGYFVGKILLLGIIPMQNFEVTHFVANGELIELSLIGNLFASYFLLRALPLFLLGIWLYWRREMGLVIRK
jgi:hypothetical protein